jgi:hypothetical protein
MPRIEILTTWGPGGLSIAAVEVDDTGDLGPVIAELSIEPGYRLTVGPAGARSEAI